MNTTTTDQETDEFFDMLKAKLPKPKRVICPTPSAISDELLERARETANAHIKYLIENGLYVEILKQPLAAASKDDLPFEIQSIGGEWSVTRETTASANWQKLKWRCRKECQELFEGRRVTAEIAGQPFDLGEIFNGIAETDIPRNLDLTQDTVVIKIEAFKDY